MEERRRYGLAPTPGIEKEWVRVEPKPAEIADRLRKVTLSLDEIPTYVSPPMDGPSGSW
jgi:hypothetical protein